MDSRLSDHTPWMRLALQQAEQAAREGEVPVGAVVVRDGQVLAQAHNRTLQLADPSAHAEMLALRQAAARLGNHRLTGCSLYVTLEPCPMCTGAALQSRVERVVFGAAEPKTGAAGSVVNLFANRTLNHQTEWLGGVLADASAQLLAEFFRSRRQVRRHAASCADSPQARLSEAALRSPEYCFTGGPPAGRYRSIDAPGLSAVRLHCQRRDGNPAQALLLLHPLWHWSAWWEPLLAQLQARGGWAMAPDLPGWGRSDKPKKRAWHTLQHHAQVLLELLQAEQAPPLTVVAQDGSEALGAALAALAPQRVLRLVQLAGSGSEHVWPAPEAQVRGRHWTVADHLRRTLPARWQPQIEVAAAPYPDRGHAGHWGGWTDQATGGPPSAAAAAVSAQIWPADAWHGAAALADALLASGPVSDRARGCGGEPRGDA